VPPQRADPPSMKQGLPESRGSYTLNLGSLCPPTDRAGCWVTRQVGRCARSVAEVAAEFGCDLHTVNDSVLRYGEALIDKPGRFGNVTTLGLDEVLFVRRGAYRSQEFPPRSPMCARASSSTSSLVEVPVGPPNGSITKEWTGTRTSNGRPRSVGTVFDALVPGATQVADPFHVVKHANAKLDEARRRVHGETLGHHRRRADPLYRIRPLLTKAEERLEEPGRERLLGLLRAGDPRGEVANTWHAKEAVRELYAHGDEATARQCIERPVLDMADPDNPLEVRSLGQSLARWKEQIVAWHRSHVSNGPTEAANNLIKRLKRAAFGSSSFRNFRVRALLYAGKPRWSLLETITPR